MRPSLVTGNWKMNLTMAEPRGLAEGPRERLAGVSAVEIVVCPSFVCPRRIRIDP